jgi:hypothetical protein
LTPVPAGMVSRQRPHVLHLARDLADRGELRPAAEAAEKTARLLGVNPRFDLGHRRRFAQSAKSCHHTTYPRSGFLIGVSANRK